MTLQTVGINDLTSPIRIREKSGGIQQTLATINLQAELPHKFMNSCISAMGEILSEYARDIHAGVFKELLDNIQNQLQARATRLEMSFPYFLPKKAPVSDTNSLMEYQCAFTATSTGEKHPVITVTVPVTTLCPCSKEISEAGAHNQRAEVTLSLQPSAFIWLEDLISLVEGCGSCELYALLKRPDEKFVTELAYNNPMFVEDVARKVAQKAMEHPDIKWFSVGVESFESIHKHSAYAFVDSNDLQAV